ncbi:MAG: hypothetical protein BWY66_00947 [bacterium ADurb.Bin374]|nr:MAG: hypothetical protein BWY66_00947 [bacterium ADurb.Bin374]
MSFLDLVEKQDAVRLFADRVGELSTLLVSDVAGRRADQARDGVLFHIFTHIETQEGDPERLRHLARHLGLANTRRSGKQEAAHRPPLATQPGTRTFDAGHEGLDGLVLAENDAPEHIVERLEPVGIRRRDAGRWNARHARNGFLDIPHADGLALLVFRRQLVQGGRLVDQVDRLVGKELFGEMPRRKVNRGFQSRSGIRHAMERLV